MAVIETGRVSLDIILIGAAAGIMVGIMSISGLAFGMTMQLLALSGDNVFLLLLLIAVLAFVLGIGLPTVSVYILTATLLAPALIKLGVTPMAAHMFVMYNGMLSMITPPVAFAAYAAANIARTDGWTTGWVACLVGWSTFILPFLFVLTPSLLMDGPGYLIVWNFVRILFALFVGTAAIVGFALAPLSMPMRAASMASSRCRSCCRRKPSPAAIVINFIGIAAGIALLVFDCDCGRAADMRPKANAPPCGGASLRIQLRNSVAFAPDAERFLRRPVGDREQHRLVLRRCASSCFHGGTTNTSFGPHSSTLSSTLVEPSPSTQTKIVPSVDGSPRP